MIISCYKIKLMINTTVLSFKCCKQDITVLCYFKHLNAAYIWCCDCDASECFTRQAQWVSIDSVRVFVPDWLWRHLSHLIILVRPTVINPSKPSGSFSCRFKQWLSYESTIFMHVFNALKASKPSAHMYQAIGLWYNSHVPTHWYYLT